MTTCRATGSDPNDYFLIHLRILICSVMACLLRWVEGGGVGTQRGKKGEKTLWTICSLRESSLPAGGDQSATGISCMPESEHLKLLAVNPKLGKCTKYHHARCDRVILPCLLLKESRKDSRSHSYN